MSSTTLSAPEAAVGFHRHAFVWLDTTCADFACLPEHLDTLQSWLAHSQPLIIRRPGLSPDGATLSVGLALPPSAPNALKVRLPFDVPISAIRKISLPPLWAACPTASHPIAGKIHTAAAKGGAELRMFGSHAWQHLTGLPYVSPSSDLDLLIFLDSPAAWQGVRDALSETPLPPGIDLEIVLSGDASFSWREYSTSPADILFKGNSRVWKDEKSAVEKILRGRKKETSSPHRWTAIAQAASRALRAELAAYPKPGLVSPVDSGSHPDMDAEAFLASIAAIEPFIADLARAGACGADWPQLQEIGLLAEQAMMKATGGRNTHRGAIFSLGLLAAAAGHRAETASSDSLGSIVRDRWADGILLPDDLPGGSDGINMGHRHGVGGARREAKEGFPSVYHIGLPALRKAGPHHSEACIQIFFELLAQCEDTTLLKRGGRDGWLFACSEANRFLAAGGVFTSGWETTAEEIHCAFVARNLTAGGVADLLAATLFVHELEESS